MALYEESGTFSEVETSCVQSVVLFKTGLEETCSNCKVLSVGRNDEVKNGKE